MQPAQIRPWEDERTRVGGVGLRPQLNLGRELRQSCETNGQRLHGVYTCGWQRRSSETPGRPQLHGREQLSIEDGRPVDIRHFV